MRYSIVSLFFFVLIAAQPIAQAEEPPILITNVRLIDGQGGAVVESANILIEDDRIKEIRQSSIQVKGAKVIDGKGQTAMPGLADMHVHLTWGYGDHDFLGYQGRLNAYLYAGVTSVMDLGGVMPFIKQMKRAIDAGDINGPNIYYVGPLIDSVDPAWPNMSLSMSSKAQAPEIAKYLKSNGANAIKAYANLTRNEVQALVRAGKEQELPVIVDAWFRNGMEHFITTGLKAFAHTPRSVTDKTLSMMQRMNVSIITTRSVGGVVPHTILRGSDFLLSDLIQNTVPKWALEKAKNDIQRVNSDKEYVENNFSMDFHTQLQTNVKKLFDAGIPLIAGSDDGLFPGDDLHFELELLVDAGLTPIEAITTATKNAAQFVDELDEWGTLEAGKRADLILVQGKPDKNISDTRNIQMVMKGGVILDRNELILNQAKKH